MYRQRYISVDLLDVCLLKPSFSSLPDATASQQPCSAPHSDARDPQAAPRRAAASPRVSICCSCRRVICSRRARGTRPRRTARTRRPAVRRRLLRSFFRPLTTESRRPRRQPPRAPHAPRAGFTGTSLHQLFAGRKVVLFALPGAFTGVCEKGHVPSFAKLVNDFKKKGVDEVACISINDPYCMDGWAAAMGTSGINFYADADETFTRAVEETRDCTADALGPGLRSNRYACVVEDGIVGACFVEAGPGDLAVSDGATLLGAL